MLHRAARREGAGAQAGHQIDEAALSEVHIPRYNDELVERRSGRGGRRSLNEDRPADREAPLLELGRLTRPSGEAGGQARTKRDTTDGFAKKLYAATEKSDREIVAAVEKIATARGVPMAQVALAWVRQQPGITAPIVGATKLQHLDDAIASLGVTLDPAELRALEGSYMPHAVAGF